MLRELRARTPHQPPRHGLAWPSATWATTPISYEDVAGKGAKQIPFSQVALDDATRYAAEDADMTLRLHRVLWPKLAAEPALRRVYREIEMPLVPVLERIEANGVLIDVDELRRAVRRARPSACSALRAAGARTGRAHRSTSDSPKQIGEILFDELKLPVLVKTPSGAAVDRRGSAEKLIAD